VVATGNKESAMRRLFFLILAVVIIAAGGLAGRSVAAAQPEPQPVTLPCATNVSAQVLGTTPDAAAGKSLVLARIIFGPGGSIGAHTHPGTLVVSVEAGDFGFTLLDQGEMPVMRSQDAGTPAVAEPMTRDQEVELAPGDWFVETGMIHSARNLGDEPTAVLLTGLIAAGQPLTQCVEGTPMP
jgi:quercetin dioxygenase-like cupin family protein